MIKNLYISLIYSITLSAGTLVDAFNHAHTHNHNMKLSNAQLNTQIASSFHQEQRSNIKLVADGFGRYYLPQTSGLDNGNFNLPKKTVREYFLKANLNVTLSKDIYNKEKDALKALAKEKVKRAVEEVHQNKNHLILDLIHQYFSILEKYDALLLSQAHYELSNKELEEGRAKESVGEVDPVEYQLLKSKNLELKVAQNIYFNRVKNAIEDFELLSQMKLDSIQVLQENIAYKQKSVPSLLAYEEHLINENPSLLKLEKNIAIATKNVALAQAKYEPALTAQMGYEYTNNFTPIFLGETYESGVFVGLVGRLPLYTAGRYDAETRKVKMQIAEERRVKEKEEHQLLVALKKEYRLYHSIPLEIEAARHHLQSLSLLKEQAQLKTEVGTMFTLEKEKISFRYLELESYLKRLEYNYFLADTNVKYLSGKLSISDLGNLENELSYQKISLKYLANSII